VTLLTCLLLGLCVLFAGVFAGSETGLYSLSRLRVEAEAREGRSAARLIRRLLRDDTGLLVTLLLGVNLSHELATHLGGYLVARMGVAPFWRELAVTLLLTPVMFLFADLMPKDLFRRRPHTLVGFSAPLLAAAKTLFFPLALPIRAISSSLQSSLGLEAHELARVHGREAVLELLQESEAAIQPQLESMARNVLDLRQVPIERVMVPWRKVESLPAALGNAQLYERIARSPYSRLPIVDAHGAVLGYVHQLEILGAGPEAPVLDKLRPLACLEPSLALDRALARLRESGQRAAVVGSPTRPVGLVALKDIVEEISGELTRW
jgi:magnesium and cobalt exporter, CNNM family